jgi:hypothetical protein
MLHLILAQIEKNFSILPTLEKGAPFCLFHEGLVDEMVKKIDSSGLEIDEGAFMKEMRDTFSRFDGKKLIFDGQGPYIDDEGGVHLPFHKEPKEMELKPIFSNLTVGVRKKNFSQQASYNEKALAELKSLIGLCQGAEKKGLLVRLSTIEEKLNNKKSNIHLATDLFVLSLDIKDLLLKEKKRILAVSQGCFSAKDRTSAVSESVVLFKGVVKSIQRQISDPKLAKSVQNRVAKRIYLEEHISAKITEQNSGVKVVKIQALTLPGISKTPQNLYERARYYGKQGKTIIQEKWE